MKQINLKLSILLLLFFTSALLFTWSSNAGKWPWQRRIGKDVAIYHKKQHQRVTVDMWPSEPASPTNVDLEQFKTAFETLCGKMPQGRLEKYATAILNESNDFNIDPFLLGSLIYDRSGCRPKTPDNATKFGLTRIDIAMHASHIRNKQYKYYIFKDNQWQEKFLLVDKFPFNRWKAAKWNSNIYWAAAILKVFKEQHQSLDIAFPVTKHRHYVSHWFFGDNVREIEPEDRILTARRRLIAYYNETKPVEAGEFNETTLFSPLDGVPRLVLDDFGNKRGIKGGAGHQGIDLVAPQGEPIRAMASGRIVFAGVDLPGAGQSKDLSPTQAEAYSRNSMGKGGLYVAINHGKGFRTYYMHMDSISVNHWQEVKSGQIIGTVGRTGAAQSGSHLHLEFRIAKKRADPAEYMQKVLVDPKRFFQNNQSN